MAANKGKTVILDVGGTVFKTSMATLKSHQETLFYHLVKEDAPIKADKKDGHFYYFIDRSPKHFDLILTFLRRDVGAPASKMSLPYNYQSLYELLSEAQFYGITDLQSFISQRLQEI
ncbi:hypothetical protein SNE40_011319 [Patella caerulea]